MGWGLNPGVINRNINGSADDIEKGDAVSFIYDEGGQFNYYKAGIGVNLYGITAGVGAYWGSNRTLGGSVSFGVGPASLTVGGGTLGNNIGVGYLGSTDDLANNISNGMTFSSFRTQGLQGVGAGISSANLSYSESDYSIRESSNDIGVSVGFANFYFGHTTIIYDLFLLKKNSYYGILNPKAIWWGGSIFENNVQKFIKNNDQNDVNTLAVYNQSTNNINEVGDVDNHHLCDNISLPNFDNYRVMSQGISGLIKPNYSEEVGLQSNDFNSMTSRPEPNWGTNYFELNKNIFFEFENTNTSFLRINRTNVKRDLVAESTYPQAAPENLLQHRYNALRGAKTDNSGLYDENLSVEGNPLKNGSRKRVGESIEVYTNSEILSSAASLGFIEAKNLNRNQPAIYKPKAIGGYKITALDGKVYHYSLPVMNFEIWYKNYGNANNEYSNFVETQQREPFATDWLLTGVTGPDYVDVNSNNMLDKDDYGYWVEFDYGKWSDGYVWNGSSGKNDVVKNDVGSPDRYEMYKGRKQIYYLDAIKTRTHTAYFIKSLRQDAMGQKWDVRNSDDSPVNWLSGENEYCNYDFCHSYQPRTKSLDVYNVPEYNQYGDKLVQINGREMRTRYMRFPAHFSLKLDKIILVKNESLIINKSAGIPLVSEKKAYMYENQGFNITNARKKELVSGVINWSTESNGYYFSYPAVVQELNIHQSENVIDVNDIVGNADNQAEKIINFKYDYSIMPNSLNTSAANKGKLCLKGVQMLGKKGVAYLPDYKFGYENYFEQFNSNNEDDWGYNKNMPASWSLNEITVPSGARIKINYESDDYSFVASRSSLNSPNVGKGGGIRVKDISTYNETSLISKSKYFYNLNGFDKNILDSNYRSSGSLSFIPSKQKVILPYASELPPPVVMYKNVSLEQYSSIDQFLMGTNYNFETLENYNADPNFTYNLGGKYLTIKKTQDETTALPEVYLKRYEIKSFLSHLGRLKSIKTYNSKNQILSVISNQYSNFANSETINGVNEESYLTKYQTSYKGYQAISVSKTVYSSKLLSSTNEANGLKSSIYYDKYDFLTGQVTETRNVSSEGKVLKTKIVAAYLKYPGMGSKIDNVSNKNMLSQTTATYS